MPLVVTVFATAPGAGTHSISDVVASIGAGWSGVPPAGAGDDAWADGFDGPGSWSDEQPASVSSATASDCGQAPRLHESKYPTPVVRAWGAKRRVSWSSWSG